MKNKIQLPSDKDLLLSLQEERDVLVKRALEAVQQGAKIRDPNRIDIRGELIFGNNVEIDVNVIIEGRVVLGDGVRIGANCILIASTIGEGTIIHPYSLVEKAVIGESSFVGPYGRVRPGSILGDHVQIGNFVEIKKSRVASSCRINHLTFVGDADLGEGVTLGAGTITCNYDGVSTHCTTIEKGAFIGSGCNLIAPIKIGSNATVGSGSTVTKDVIGEKLTIARSRQVTVENWKGPQ
tara:strand:- start:3108 stop:3821 length:714 start_codon:yes stop_codon:yes gene_type:complete